MRLPCPTSPVFTLFEGNLRDVKPAKALSKSTIRRCRMKNIQDIVCFQKKSRKTRKIQDAILEKTGLKQKPKKLFRYH